MIPIHLPNLAILLLTGFFLFFGCLQPGVAAPIGRADAGALTPLPNFIALVKNQGPAVVNIIGNQKGKKRTERPAASSAMPEDPVHDFFRRFGLGEMPQKESRSQSFGAGFIIDPTGYILTNSHVVEDADEVIVGLTDIREFKARLIGIDKRSDVALLKIEADHLPVVRIGDPSKLEVGEWVVAIGAPFGFANSVTQGIVSAKGRDLPGENIVPFIQTDVALNPGSSGGPLFNLRGEVVGINSQIVSQGGGSDGISFAIPIDVAMKIKTQLLTHGTIRRGKLGIAAQSLNQELAESFALENPGGALIASLERGGPAALAGLQVGDILLAFNGKSVTSPLELSRLLAETPPGTKTRLKFWRDGAAQEITVKLGEAGVRAQEDEPISAGKEADALGLSLRELNRAERRLSQSEGGVVVVAVDGIAALSGIQPGDIILGINHLPVASIEALRIELSRIGKRAALLIQRDANTRMYISLNRKI